MKAAVERLPFVNTLRPAVRRYRALVQSLRWFLLGLIVRSERLTSLYYGVASPSFRKEHHAVLRGTLRYYRESRGPNNQYFLRRNIHRLEKGLLMRPRRDVFAVDYIERTVDAYATAVAQAEPARRPELRWAHDVLERYFAVTASHPVIDRARQTFATVQPVGEETSDDPEPRIPYVRELGDPPVTYESLLDLAIRRRSVRWFVPKQVPRSLIDRAVQVASLSPSSCNRQPYQFRILDDAQLAHKVASLAAGTGGFHHNIPALAVVVGKLDAFAGEEDRHLIYIDASLAVMSFILALETQGLSSCCINWKDDPRRERELRRLVHLEPEERVVMLVALGYPDPRGMVARSERKPLDQLRRYGAS